MEKYEKSYQKSCNVKRIRYKGKVYSIDMDALAKFLLQSSLAILLSGAVIVGGVKAVDNLNEYKDKEQMKSQYAQVLYENTHRTNDLKNFWYDYEGIAKDLLNSPDDFGLQIYCIYDRIGLNREHKLECMDKLIEQINIEISKNPEKYKNFETHKNFGYYLIDNGYISTDDYENNMGEVLDLRMEAKEGKTL